MDPLKRRLPMSGGFDQFTDSSESERRHIVINALILSFRDQIGLMPNTDIATVTDILAKARPRRQVRQIRVLRISSESPKRLPVLKKQYRSTKPDVAAHKTKIRLAPKLGQHTGHGQKHRQPLMNFPRAIDSHTDEKDAE